MTEMTASPTIFPRVGYSIISFHMFINTIVSVFNNSLVIAVMAKTPTLLSPMNAIVLGLSVSDLMITLCGSLIVTMTNYRGYFFLGDGVCIFQGFAVNYFGKSKFLLSVLVKMSDNGFDYRNKNMLCGRVK